MFTSNSVVEQNVTLLKSNSRLLYHVRVGKTIYTPKQKFSNMKIVYPNHFLAVT